MKNLIYSVLFIIFLFSCSKDSSTSSDSYTSGGDILPLKLDNSWNYYQDVEGMDVTLSISNDDIYYKWDGMADNVRFYGDSYKSDHSQSASIFALGGKSLAKTSTGVAVGAWNNAASKIVTLFVIPNQPTVGTDSYGNTWSQVESVQTVKGTFKNCWKCTLGGSLSGYMIFKKGIGVVYGSNFARNFSLESYTLK